MKIYNSLTRRKEEFVPLEKGKVKMYACGITVSGEAHIGHGYQALVYDVMRKYLSRLGYDVAYARNYTDVDDKIIQKSRELKVDERDYAAAMIKKIDAVMGEMKIDEPNIWLKATESIGEIISFIQRLVDGGHAYSTPRGDVYFDVSSFGGYGCLSNRSPEDMLDGVRVDNDEEKRSPVDFALWKAAKPGEIFWESPWGKGRPGWHIECSAMNYKAFGEQIDIHGGGRDLIFPHHENEIAQTESLTGKQFARFWTHNGLIKINGQKMSKSLGNTLTLEDALSKYTSEAIKFALLQFNYRADINLTDALFVEAEGHLSKFYSAIKAVREKFGVADNGNEEIAARFKAAMDDDFNTALALSDLFGYFKEINAKLSKGDKSCADDVKEILDCYAALDMFKLTYDEYFTRVEKLSGGVPAEIEELAKKRWHAKQAKNWAEADELRKKLDELGFAVKDGKDGYVVIKK